MHLFSSCFHFRAQLCKSVKFNQVKFMQDLDSYISKVADLGFLVATRQSETSVEPRYKIHRIIKEKITLDDLVEFKNKLNNYDTTDESI